MNPAILPSISKVKKYLIFSVDGRCAARHKFRPLPYAAFVAYSYERIKPLTEAHPSPRLKVIMLENAHLSEGVAVAKQRVTIADVAREAGTSTASVSYYLNDKREKLSEKTQNKIARVIKELGYVPNAQAQTLTGKQTHVIAIIILDNTNKWAGLVLNGMEQVMLPAGYQTVVCTSNFNPETELMYVDKMLSLGVDGFIIQPTANFKAVHDRIRRAGKPVVFFDAAIYSPGTSWIKTNLYDGVYNATQALLDAGYEDFFSIAANMTEMRTRMERFQGYAEALAANGQLYKAIPIDHNKPSINELTEYFKFKFNPAKRTLIFVQNQWALPRVYKALQPMAHLLPQQIGLLGLNCENWTNLTTPTVSTIIEPVDQEGREAAEMLLALLDGSSEPGEQRILECKLNWLDSTSI